MSRRVAIACACGVCVACITAAVAVAELSGEGSGKTGGAGKPVTSTRPLRLTFDDRLNPYQKWPTTTTTTDVVVPVTVPPSTRRPVAAVVQGTAASNRMLGQSMAAERGWVGAEWNCLDVLWGVRESGWRTNAGTPSRSYGIPQSLPGNKMATAGADWLTNPRTQIAWGNGYIAGRYGTPCSALDHSYAMGWY